MLRSKRFPTIGIAHSQIAHRTPESQRQGDVWVNSGEDRVQLPLASFEKRSETAT